ncbi:MAG: trehalase family glycosidase [Bacteroidales bacterium]
MKRELLYCSVLAFMAGVLPGCMTTKEKHEPDLRNRFTQILDIRYTPAEGTRCGGWFTDNGSWMGFTIPETNSAVNGFCGPFSLEYRFWYGRSLVQASFESEPREAFRTDSVNYLPGELYLKGVSPTGTIEQHLLFADKSTSVLQIRRNGKEPLRIFGDTLTGGMEYKKEGERLVVRSPKGELVVLGFSPGAQVNLKGNSYEAIWHEDQDLYVTLTLLNKEEEMTACISSLAAIYKSPDSLSRARDLRWNGYLSKVIRTDMDSLYNRVAAKSVVTLISNWKSKRGGLLHDGVVPSHAVGYFMGFWAWDSWKHAVALSYFQPELAKDQIRAMFDYQTPQGMVIDCIYADTAENNYRDSKPPLAAWAVHEVYKQTGDTAFVKEMMPQLTRYHDWWYAFRDHDRNGICEFGSVDGTLEAAAWESGMDNAIRFDEAAMVRNGNDAWSFNQESVDLNAYLAYEGQILSELSRVAATPYVAKPDLVKRVQRYFFDESDGFFYDRKLKDSTFIRVQGSEAYIPFWSGIATNEQMDKALSLFTDTAKFTTFIPFPTVAADDPKFLPKGYWRGPIWLDQTYFAIRGLRNYGHREMADQYTQDVFERLDGLTASAPIHENYGTHTGERLKAPHFSWSSAHLLLLYLDYGK